MVTEYTVKDAFEASSKGCCATCTNCSSVYDNLYKIVTPHTAHAMPTLWLIAMRHKP